MDSHENSGKTRRRLGRDYGSGGPRVQSQRPWLAVWLHLLDRAMNRESVPPPLRPAWRAALSAFLEAHRRHPSRIAPAELRDFLFRTGELGGTRPDRSLTTAMDVLAFFYAEVVPHPTLMDAARHPFTPIAPGPDDADLFDLLKEKLVANGAAACIQSPDWTAIKH